MSTRHCRLWTWPQSWTSQFSILILRHSKLWMSGSRALIQAWLRVPKFEYVVLNLYSVQGRTYLVRVRVYMKHCILLKCFNLKRSKEFCEITMNYDSLSIHLFHYIYQLLDLSAPTCKIKIFAKAKCPIVFFVQRNGFCSTIGKFTGPIFHSK